MDRDEFYQTILSGIASYRDDPFVRDVLASVAADPSDLNLAYSLNKNQVASKCWLMAELRQAAGDTFDTVYVLGGWYGTLAAMLLVGCGDDMMNTDGGTDASEGMDAGPPGECGNDDVEAGEVCDDGNTVGGDGCAADCRSVP